MERQGASITGLEPAEREGAGPPDHAPRIGESYATAVERAASDGSLRVLDGQDWQECSWAEVHGQARRRARVLTTRGVGPGAHLFLIGRTSTPFITTLQAVLLTGASVTIVPPTPRARTAGMLREQVQAFSRSSPPDMLLCDDEFAPVLSELPTNVATVEALAKQAATVREDAFDLPAVDPSAVALVQYTSGSTADPKGVLVTHGQLVDNIDAIATRCELGSRDTFVSWLPLYHDMGLIGFCLLPTSIGASLAIMDPAAFATRPASWMEAVAHARGTVIGAPNFAYGLASIALSGHESLDLGSVRLAFNGAEPIVPEVVRTFNRAASSHGLPGEAMYCVYGMAEATLAVTFPDVGAGMQVDTVDPEALAYHRAPTTTAGRELAKLGSPIPRMQMRVVGGDGAPCSEREVGEIQIAGPSVTRGYAPRGTPDRTAFDGEWFETGDLGYVADRELVVCGRLRDMIVIAGRNVYPHDVELVVGSVPGIRGGGVVVFGTTSGKSEGIAVVAERRGSDDLRGEVAKAVRDAIGVTPAEIVLVPPGTVPKTPSGKVQRGRCRSLYERGALTHEDPGASRNT